MDSPGRDRPMLPGLAERLAGRRHMDDASVVTRRLAHDYGNVLTGILGYCELALNQAPAGSPIHRFVQEAHRAAQQGAELTRLLQLFGCQQATPTQPSAVPVVAAEEAGRLRTLLGTGAEIRWDVPAELPPVALGENVLRTLLAQVLNNAREALTGQGIITLAARETELGEAECRDLLGSPATGPCIEVGIADNGAGLSEDARQNLFVQPFYSSKPRHRGLGLAVVYGILRSHGGGFRLDPGASDSFPGQACNIGEGAGTIVRLYLPLATVIASAPAPPTRCATGKEKVLVVDDERTVLQMVRVTLQAAGYRVQTAASSAQALASYAAADREPFQLVLSDVLMPGENGFDLARELRRQDANANVLFMSGHASPELARAHGVDWPFDLLFKPFRIETLLRAVRTALDRGRGRVSFVDGGSREEAVVRSPRQEVF